MARLDAEGRSIEIRAGDSVLTALLRAGMHPTGGGCLCCSGDCPHCLATVDGVAYTRTCQTPARDGMVIRREHRSGGTPPLLAEQREDGENRGTRPGDGEATSTAGIRPGTEAAGDATPNLEAAPVRHVHCDTVVVGQGRSGRKAADEARAAGKEVVTLDDSDGQHVTGVYPGPLVVALDRDGKVLQVHPRHEIVVATGAAEIQPVAPGSDLEGLVTSRAALALVAAEIDLGRVLLLSTGPMIVDPDNPVPHTTPRLPPGVAGELVRLGETGWEVARFEGSERVEAVVFVPHGMAEEVAAADPERRAEHEFRLECDTAILDLGHQPRTALARMAADLPVRVVGSAAREADSLPPCPRKGVVCPCSGVTVADLDDVWRRGFREMELLKRATLAGTGACQGGACLPHLRSFLLDRGGRLQPAFTARPLNRQLTVRELAAGAHTPATARSPLHEEHLRLGACMERAAGWWRPWRYGHGPGGRAAGPGDRGQAGDTLGDAGDGRHKTGERRPTAIGARGDASDPHAEYRAVRERVSLGDVSSLGKFAVAGPDAEAFLERIVPTRVATIRPGRCRYVLMLDERGHVLDDGMLCRDEDSPGLNEKPAATRRPVQGVDSRSPEDGGDRFFLTSTSGGSTFVEAWLRDWAESFGFDVRILNQTTSLAAINVTGPMAARLLARAGSGKLPPFARQRRVEIAGVDCRVLRLSFTGELSYELHHAAADSASLWRRLLQAGAPLEIRPHGLETLLRLRLEKGHIVVGQDTDFDSTPRRLRHEWAVDMTKGDFIGRQAILRTDRRPLDRALVALEMTAPPAGQGGRFLEGAAIHDGDRYAGHVTSAGYRGAVPGAGTDDSGSGAAGPGTATAAVSPGTEPPARPPPGLRVDRGRVDPGSEPPDGREPGLAMLGWLHVDADGNLPREVTVAGRPARRADRALYDPHGKRARLRVDLAEPSPGPGEPEAEGEANDTLLDEPNGHGRGDRDTSIEADRASALLHSEGGAGEAEHEVARHAGQRSTGTESGIPSRQPRLRPLEATRVAASPAALDRFEAEAPWPAEAVALRTATDELLVTAPLAAPTSGFAVDRDPEAIVVRETGFRATRLERENVERLLEGACDWKPPTKRPALAQGEVAGIAVKLRLDEEGALLLVPAPFAAAFERRMQRALGGDGRGGAVMNGSTSHPPPGADERTGRGICRHELPCCGSGEVAGAGPSRKHGCRTGRISATSAATANPQ